jgi:hypothetical protein
VILAFLAKAALNRICPLEIEINSLLSAFRVPFGLNSSNGIALLILLVI